MEPATMELFTSNAIKTEWSAGRLVATCDSAAAAARVAEIALQDQATSVGIVQVHYAAESKNGALVGHKLAFRLTIDPSVRGNAVEAFTALLELAKNIDQEIKRKS